MRRTKSGETPRDVRQVVETIMAELMTLTPKKRMMAFEQAAALLNDHLFDERTKR